MYASFSAREREDFFKRWVKAALGNKSVFYDVTSISSYAQAMPAVERGYNRDGDDLAQYNLGMFCDESTKIPLYYNRYNGSLTDRTNLSYVLANAKAVGIGRVKMILDEGFWSNECFKSLQGCCDAFTIGMPLFLKMSERILHTHGQDIERYVHELPRHPHIYCVSADAEIHSIPGRVLIYYDSYNHLNQCRELSETIERLGAELAALKRYPKNKLSRYAPYFVVTRHEHDNGFDYRVDSDKMEIRRKAKGYFLIFSTDLQASPADILEHYRAKDADEKLFAQIKVEMDGSRIRTHNEATTDGKTFVTFIACVIQAYMLNKLTQYLTEHSTSLKKVFTQLSNITILSNQDGCRFAKALTKKQKQILSAFNAVDDIVSTLKF